MSYYIFRCTASVVRSRFRRASPVVVRPILFFISYIAYIGNRMVCKKLDKTLVAITTKIPQGEIGNCFCLNVVIWIFCEIFYQVVLNVSQEFSPNG